MSTSRRKCDPPASPDDRTEQVVFDSYRLFDRSVSSQIPLPELTRCVPSEPLITVCLGGSVQLHRRDFETCHDWHDVEGRLICRCSRRGADYLLSLPQQANFHITVDGTITCAPASATTQLCLRQILLNQVLPRYFAHTGELVLHASAATLPNGKTVAFVGESGSGKSTLASYCHLQGAQIVDDDCVLLRCSGQRISVYGGVPTLRLYPDSLHALGYEAGSFTPYINGSDKLQMCLVERSPLPAQPIILDAIYIVGVTGEAVSEATVRISAAPGQAAMMALLGNVFTLDPSDQETMRLTFDRAARLLSGGLPVYHLNFVRQYRLLPQVLQALLDHV